VSLLAEGDPIPHVHALPVIPSLVRHYPRSATDPTLVEHTVYLRNAVARCCGCGGLFVSRQDPDAYGPGWYWAPLRWWHRKAWAKVRVLQAAAEGGVAP
jgi:hypothetical protein